MRWGKTKVAIDFANCLYMKEGICRVLVVCPLSVCGVWESEIAKHTDTAQVPFCIVTRDDILEGWVSPDIPSGISWHIVNYERTYARANLGGRSWAAVPDKALERFSAELVIADESHRIGNPSTVASRHVCRLGRQAKHRLIMTGTMFHRKPFYVFGQAKFYDPAIFGGAFTPFKNRIAIFGGPSGYEVLRYVNLKWMMRRMRRFVYIEKYVPSRPPSVTPLYFHLTGKGLSAYAEMERESVLEVGGETVISPIVLSRHLRCQQIAGGWVKTDSGYKRVGRDKLTMATERFNDYRDNDISKVVVGCRFLPELADAARAAKASGYATLIFHGGLSQEGRERRIAAFQRTGQPCAFIAQVATGSMGIDLSSADTMLFYSLSESYLTHAQFSARIEKYKETRVLQYDYLIARGTRDEVTYTALQQKKDVAELLATDPELVERITAKNQMTKPQ